MDFCRSNVLVNALLLEAARLGDVSRYLFTSSACVYSSFLQESRDVTPLWKADAVRVRGRNSDNTLLRTVLGWEPQITLREGTERTYPWIWAELDQAGRAQALQPKQAALAGAGAEPRSVDHRSEP